MSGVLGWLEEILENSLGFIQCVAGRVVTVTNPAPQRIFRWSAIIGRVADADQQLR